MAPDAKARGTGTLVLFALLALLHLLSVLFLISPWTRMSYGIVQLGFLFGGFLQMFAFVITAIALAVSANVRRSIPIWAVTVIGAVAFRYWLSK